jgi:hypothetical protein
MDICFFPNPLLKDIITYFRFDNMAVGGLIAIFFAQGQGHRLMAFFRLKGVLYMLLAISFLHTLFPIPYGGGLGPYVYGGMLLAVALQPGALPILNNK